MTCMATRLLCNLRLLSPNSNPFARNASLSTNFSPPLCKERPRGHSLYQYQTKRCSHCRRINPCIKKKKEDAEKKLKEQQNPKSFWQTLFEPKKKKPPLQTCRKLQTMQQWQCEPIPEFIEEMCKDLPEGSCVYKTRGHAFILEVPCKTVPLEKKMTKSEVQLSKIERSKQCINLEDECNPMPKYSTVGQRLLDLHDRKLHPLYKKLEMPLTNRPKPYALETKYRCPADDLAAADNPKLSKFDLYHLRKKVSFADFKMAVLPRYLETREQAYNINTCSNLEYRKELIKCKDGKNKVRVHPKTSCPDIDCKRWNNQKPRK